jgi:hypothetical protein
MEAISFSFTPTKEDFAKSYRAYQQQNSSPVLVLILLVPALVCAIAILLYSIHQISLTYPHTSDEASRSFAASLLCIVVSGLPLFLMGPFPRLYARRMMQNLRPEDVTTWILDDERVHVAVGITEAKMGWSTFEKVLESAEHYLLIVSKKRAQFVFVPKRVFTSPEHEAAFRALVEKHLGPIKR